MNINKLDQRFMQSGFLIGLFSILVLCLTGCDAIGGIFKTGMGVGAFVVIVIVVLILLFVMLSRRRR